jgi:hypothetical protein
MVTEQTKQVVDVIAVSTGVASLVGWLPAIAAGLTIVWTGIRICETRTMQRLRGRFFSKKSP